MTITPSSNFYWFTTTFNKLFHYFLNVFQYFNFLHFYNLLCCFFRFIYFIPWFNFLLAHFFLMTIGKFLPLINFSVYRYLTAISLFSIDNFLCDILYFPIYIFIILISGFIPIKLFPFLSFIKCISPIFLTPKHLWHDIFLNLYNFNFVN